MRSHLLGLVIVIAFSFVSLSEAKLWALLVAGSRGYTNYRHQADICHAYQILKHHNIPTENIITMMYDDVANNSQNPTPGIIINQPDGKDVYAGVKKDYTGEDVTPNVFNDVLTGNKEATRGIGSGRVIESGPDDIIFVNFVDHGAPGVLRFPNEEMSVKELNDTLTIMIREKKFKKLILYVEACHAGSMFDDVLEDDTEIFVMTAADPNESSYACYFDSIRGTYLGDLFSVNWMQESEKENLEAHSLHHIFEKVRTSTEKKSHVEEYGDLDIGNTKISDILGPSNLTNSSFDLYRNDSIKDAVNSYEVPLDILYKKLRKLEISNEEEEARLTRNQIRNITENRQYLETVMDELVLRMTRNNVRFSVRLRNKKIAINRKNIDCYHAVVKEFSHTCFKIAENPFVGTQLHVLLNACDLFDNKESKIIRDIRHVCGKLQPVVTNIV